MKNLKRNTIVLIAALGFAASGVINPTLSAAQTKTQTKAKTVAPTPKTQKSPVKSAAVSSSSSSATKAKVVDKSKTASKTSGKSKDAVKSNTSAEKITSTTKTTANSKEKSVGSQSTAAKSATIVKTNQTAKTNQTPKTNEPAKIVKPAKINSSTANKTSSTTDAKVPAQTSLSSSSEKKTVEKSARKIIVAAASARVRSAPKADAEVVSTADIGKTFAVSEENSGWYKIRLQNDKSGWISKTVAADFDDDKSAEIYRKIVAKYFNKNNKLDFATAAQIADFLKTSATEKSNAADLNFKRLLALNAALRSVPADRAAQNPYKDFLKANEKDIAYSEPAGEWYVRSDLFWELQNRAKDTPLGEEIAWTAAQNPLPGECEGYVNCYIYLLRVTDGEYLNFYPGGKYAKKSVQNITNLLEPIVADLKEKKIYTAATDISDRAEFNRLLTELRTIISKVPFVEKARAVQQINQIGEGFR